MQSNLSSLAIDLESIDHEDLNYGYAVTGVPRSPRPGEKRVEGKNKDHNLVPILDFVVVLERCGDDIELLNAVMER